MELADKLEGKREDDGNHRGERHPLEGDGAQSDAGRGNTQTEDDSRQHQVQRIVVVDIAFCQYANTGSGDNTKEKQGNAAHNRNRNALNESRQFAETGKNDGKDRCAAADAAPPNALFLVDIAY